MLNVKYKRMKILKELLRWLLLGMEKLSYAKWET